jgi:hypothetical protein
MRRSLLAKDLTKTCEFIVHSVVSFALGTLGSPVGSVVMPRLQGIKMLHSFSWVPAKDFRCLLRDSGIMRPHSCGPRSHGGQWTPTRKVCDSPENSALLQQAVNRPTLCPGVGHHLSPWGYHDKHNLETWPSWRMVRVLCPWSSCPGRTGASGLQWLACPHTCWNVTATDVL